MNEQVLNIQNELRQLSNKKIAEHSQRSFKTGNGQYGEGDRFLGIRVPILRGLARKYRGIYTSQNSFRKKLKTILPEYNSNQDLVFEKTKNQTGFSISIDEASQLLKSQFHEERLLSILLLVDIFKSADIKGKEAVFHLYLGNTKFINNWDIVDSSAPHIVGAYLRGLDKQPIYTHHKIVFGKKPKLFCPSITATKIWFLRKPKTKPVLVYDLANSKSLWERRISIMSTFHFIKNNEFVESLKLSRILLYDKEDLIHKTVGWMLREIGKRNIKVEEEFLKTHYKTMPRTMLRYAKEKFPEEQRKKYLGSGRK